MQTCKACSYFLGIAVSAMMIGSGCTDPTRVEHSSRTVVAASDAETASIDEQPPLVQFEISADAKGAYRPGTSIVITYGITSQLADPAARVTVVLPDVEVAKLNNWKQARAPANRRLQAAVDRIVPVSPGGEVERGGHCDGADVG